MLRKSARSKHDGNDTKAIAKEVGASISIVSLVDGKGLLLDKSDFLGEGSFASVYSLQNNKLETDFVCKEIQLQHPEGQGFLAR